MKPIISIALIKILITSQFLFIVNTSRIDNGLNELRYSHTLEEIAKYRADSIKERGKFEHCSHYELTQIAYRYSYPGALGENLAIGYEMEDEVFEAFMNSPTHRDNILDKEYTEIGYYKDTFEGRPLMVVIFGSS